MAPAPALRFVGVHKRFGKRRALDGLDLEIPAGSCFGLIGPNGAGKTTAFSLACGFLRPDAGEVEILGGRGFELPRLKGRVGALPQDAALGRETRCREHLLYLGRLGGLPETEARRQADLRLAEVGLSDRAGARVKTLSHGMLRRLAVAQALLGAPDLVLLDEPTSGLDPRHAHELRELLARVRDGDQLRTVVISSHNLHELERLCDHVAFMDAGVVRTAGATELVTGRGQEVEIALGPGPAPVAALEAALAGAQLAQARVAWDEGSRKLQLSFPPGEQRQPEEVVTLALKALIEAGARISEVRRGSTLEQKFLRIS